MANYAIVTASGEIVSLHTEAVPAGDGWGVDRELVELAQPHRVGDRIEWDARGREIVAADEAPHVDLARQILRAANDEGTIQVDQMIALGLPPYAASVRTALNMAGVDAETAAAAARAEGWADSPLSE